VDNEPDELADLLEDYALLGAKLLDAEGSGAAALVRERRIVRGRIAELTARREVAVIDDLATRREAKATVDRPPSRRRKSR
jgi:hypothetical protein